MRKEYEEKCDKEQTNMFFFSVISYKNVGGAMFSFLFASHNFKPATSLNFHPAPSPTLLPSPSLGKPHKGRVNSVARRGRRVLVEGKLCF